MRSVLASRGAPKATVKITASDTAQTLEDGGVDLTVAATAGSRNAIGALVTLDKPGGVGYDIRCTFGNVDDVTPTTTLGHIMYAGDSIYLDNPASLKTFQFINRSAGSNAVLHVTVEFEPGAGT